MNVTGVNGVSAEIEEYNPFYTGVNHAGTNVTIMLTNAKTNQWAQLGWYKSKIDNGVNIKRQVGLEYRSAQEHYFSFWPAEPTGQLTWYQILWENPFDFNFFKENQNIWNEAGLWTPEVYEMFGETHDRADQVPGGATNHVTVRNAYYFVAPGHTAQLSVANMTPSLGATWFEVANPANGRYEMWDDACAGS